eukprot:m.163639 g.163639  ORF g.163639 m.163639 type:complete len:1177 (+) comp38854_c0_seq2:70-3600(+)
MTTQHPTTKRDALREIERQVQRQWEEQKVFEANAPESNEPNSEKNKFFVTFPYPYMNGRLHLGHTFTISKAEFATGYYRMKGKHCLFPFGFHCTGMPIRACSDKLKYEMEQFGNPPVFPIETSEEVKDEKPTFDPTKGPRKTKSKVAAKTGGLKYQWQIMQAMGMSNEEIGKFAEAAYWLKFFPPLAEADLRNLGLKTDWRRSFITTDANPYYDSFVRWHFLTLKDEKRIKFGKRYTIYCVKDGQPCMDHDRSEGEGVAPQEYTGIKLRLVEPLPSKLQCFAGKKVFLVAATLRPETMYGQTNCWVGPSLQYIAFKAKGDEVFISTRRAALNMAYQGLTATENKVEELLELNGMDIMGVGLKAPLTSFDVVYTLPMLTVKADKGTGIVTSVPSDAPDDYAALQDLKRKEAFRKKYGIEDRMVLPFEPIPIIHTDEYGDLAAPTICEKMKIKSQNDSAMLQDAKDKVYKAGFYDGIMIIGECKGQKVQDVKKIIQKKMKDTNEAIVYQEPEKKVISRSGDSCIVALCDQWFLDYGNKAWKATVGEALKNVQTYSDEVRHNFIATLDWLEEHACSRSYGLGTKLPWDEQYLIESLSDSTIYMAYYTVAHLLHGGTVDGSKPGPLGIKPEQLTQEVWDYIFFLSAPKPATEISDSALNQLRREFQYWYPLDLRVSGKDLVPNHLTYFLYNHVSVWPQESDKWPRGVRANGHLMLNSEKMSKSTGNFLTLQQSLETYGADATRFNLADAGDTVEDANFVEINANATILRLHGLLDWTKEMLGMQDKLRQGPFTIHDKVFESELNLAIKETEKHYDALFFREALKSGVFELQGGRDRYRDITSLSGGMHKDLVLRYIEIQALLLSAICPHVCEHMWSLLGKTGNIVSAPWPEAGPVDEVLLKSLDFVLDCARDLRHRIRTLTEKKGSQKPKYATVFVGHTYPPWQAAVLKCLKEAYDEESKSFPSNKEIATKLKGYPELAKFMKKAMPFAQTVKEAVAEKGVHAMNLTTPFNQEEVLKQYASYLERSSELVRVHPQPSSKGDARAQEEAAPGKPFIVLYTTDPQPHTMVEFRNPQPASGHFSLHIPICEGETVAEVAEKLRKDDGNISASQQVTVLRFTDPASGPRTVPEYMRWDLGKVLVPNDAVFHVVDDGKAVKITDPRSNETVPAGDVMAFLVSKET